MLRIGGWRQIALAMLVLAAASQPGFAQGRVIVFGDSLSDNGNLSMILPGLNPSIPGYYFTVLPSPPAPQSLAFRRSNGPVWVEQLFGTFNSPLQGTGVSGNVDLAIAGARTDATIGPPGPTPPGIAQQIGIFVGSGGGIAASDLVINWGGANNIFDCFNAGLCGNAGAISTNSLTAATSQIGNMNALIAAGGRKFLVPNLPDIGLTPAFNGFPGTPGALAQGGTLATIVYNNALDAGLHQIAATVPGVNIVQMDTFGAIQYLVANPGAFGFTNVNAPCALVPACVSAPKSVQDTFLFWDGVHPTEHGHQLLAIYASLLLDTAPAISQTIPLDEVALSANELVTNAVFDRLANWTTGLYQHKNGPYAEVLGQLASFDRDGARPGIDVDVGGVRGGFDKQFGDSVFGGSATILSGRANSTGLRSDVMTLRGDVYGTMTAGPFYFSADAGAASVWLENIERATGFGPLVAEGKTTNFVVSTTGEAGLVQRFGDVLLMPSARLTYFHSQLDGYDEQAPILALSYADRTTDALLGSVRLRAVVEANLFGSMPSSVFGEVGYEDYLSISNDQITASLVNNTALPTTVNPGDPNGPGFLGKVGISNQVSDHVFLDLNYGISVHNSGGETHSGDVRLKATF